MREAKRASQRGGVRLVAAAFLAGLCAAFGFLVLPLFVGAHLIGRCIEYGVRGEHDPRRNEAVFSAGLLTSLGILPFLGSMCVAEWVLLAFRGVERGALGWALTLQAVACVLGSAALAPLMAAGALRLGGASGIQDAIGASIALAARRPLATTLAGAAQGLMFSLPVLLLQLVRGPVGIATAIAGCAFAWAVYPALASGLAAPTTRAPRSLARLGIPTLVAVACVVPVWLAVPPPMWQWFDLARTSAVELPHDAVVQRAGRHGPIWLAGARDDAPRYVRVAGYDVSSLSVERDDTTGHVVLLILGGPGIPLFGTLGVPLDDELRRLDDSLLDRLRARANAGLFLLTMLTAIAAAWSTRTARLARRSLVGDAGTRVTTDVVLRLGDGASVESNGRALRPRGDVWLETRAGDGAVRLDRRVVLPTTSAEAPRDGTRLVLVSSEHAPRFGPRDGAAPLPEGAWLADADGADAALVLHGARAAAIAFTFAIVLGLLTGVAGLCAI